MAAEWYYTTNKQQMGPVSWPELVELARGGLIKASDKVWTDGMDEWVKAINQRGLFDDDGAEAMTASTKTPPSEAKPPPGRRSRRRDDEEDDDDDSQAKKKADRRSEEESVKTSMGIKIGLIVAGVLLLILVGVGCIGGMIWMAFGPSAKVNDTYTVTNLPVMKYDEHRFTLTSGRKVVITSTNDIERPDTDVDLYVYRGDSSSPNEKPVKMDDRRPNVDRHCKVEFVVAATDTYRVRVLNRGPGLARSCVVKIESSNRDSSSR
ncbi:MAG: DUF4339 domain-containing protein [Planctomycetes bacterium]|nr:DUF4339 domain-containing protein [Planctomycetota bacterium]